MTQRPPNPSPDSPMPLRAEDLYESTPPWEIGRPQPAFLDLAETGALSGRVLDVGCGTGEHTLMAAELGLPATGVDLATNALRTAEEKARDRGLTARFVCLDARRLDELGETYDTVLDSGLFHMFAVVDRAAYVDSLRTALVPGGRYFMIGFSDEEPGDWGPHRLTREDIAAAFADGWRIDALEPTMIENIIEPKELHAWRVALTRL